MAGGAPPADIKLSIRGVAKTYGPITALAEASLEMPEGEFLTLLGPSGSGKTTLLMIVAGLTHPTAGEVWIGGRHATYEPPNKRDIGVVFQNYALFPHLTIEENIAFPLRMRMRGTPTAQVADEVKRVLDIVQLADVGGRLPKELSGGQQQRIALARCMVYRPSIILMDEPLGALDRKLRDHMQIWIKQLHKRVGITVLYVTHDQDEALAMSDRICLMNHGRIEQLGTPEELYFRPSSAFVADFLGESNLLPATVLGADAVRAAGGLLVHAAVPAGMTAGQAVKLLVRPESVRMLAPGETVQNMVEGTLIESVFGGGTYRHFVSVSDGPTFSVKQFTARGQAVPSIGSTLRLGWEPGDTVVLGA